MDFLSNETLICAGVLGGMLVALEVGFRAGRRTAKHPAQEVAAAAGQVGVIQGAMLGLLGLLLAFSFAAAASRFLERQDLILQESNAIGTAFLRADLLDPPHKAQLRDALRRYLQYRIDASATLRRGVSQDILAEVARLQSEIWHAVRDGTTTDPVAILGVMPPVNEVFDIHSARVAAGFKRLPDAVLVLLLGCSFLSIGVISYGCGLSGHRRAALTVPLALVIGLALWITIDLDHPRSGILQLSDAPLRDLDLSHDP